MHWWAMTTPCSHTRIPQYFVPPNVHALVEMSKGYRSPRKIGQRTYMKVCQRNPPTSPSDTIVLLTLLFLCQLLQQCHAANYTQIARRRTFCPRLMKGKDQVRLWERVVVTLLNFNHCKFEDGGIWGAVAANWGSRHSGRILLYYPWKNIWSTGFLLWEQGFMVSVWYFTLMTCKLGTPFLRKTNWAKDCAIWQFLASNKIVQHCTITHICLRPPQQLQCIVTLDFIKH